MNFKYYDLLSNLTVGMVAFYALWKYIFPEFEMSEWIVIPAGYVVGYFLNALSSFIDPFLNKTICGRPSDKLLTPIPGQIWTGIKKVKFYFPEKAIDSLKKDIGDENATTGKMFGYAMRMVNSNFNCRVPDFNGHYALSRVILTTLFIAVVLVEVECYDIWYSWPISVVLLLLAWNRYKERGYYFAREVLNEYLRLKTK